MTFSIVARDPRTGALGVATATAGPLVGALVPHARNGLGAAATQAMTNPYLAIDILERLGREPAASALDAALAGDPEPDRRQVIVIDGTGAAAGWTGSRCEHHAAHMIENGVAVAGNILAGPQVLDAMLSAFDENPNLPIGERLLAALHTGAAAGGDRRGLGSAALKVFEGETYPALDLRVDWSTAPLADLTQLLQLASTGDYAAFFARVPRRFAAIGAR